MKIYLAGDSIVQDYKEEEFIAGWGQYLPKFLKEEVQVVNIAKGGRSSRLFLNEGRFGQIDNQIQQGDYLLIEFCHNDDNSKDYSTMFNRQVALGEPDEDGRYPVIPGELMPIDYLPPEYIQAVMADDTLQNKEAVLKGATDSFKLYPTQMYYPYSKDASKGSYKWFLKQYIDMAREHGATPVLITAPCRTAFTPEGHIMDGPGLHGGDNFCYIRAMKQLADESNTPLIDLFAESVRIFEEIGPVEKNKYMSIKQGLKTGKWPEDFLKELEKPETVMENTHFNKAGAMMITEALITLIKASQNKELTSLQDCIK